MLSFPVSHRQLPVCFIVWALCLQASQALAETWREIQSPHFRVITDGSDGEGRNVAKEFEQMRSVFADRFPDTALGTGAPLLIIAVRESGLRDLGTSVVKDRDRYAGAFFPGWERQFALVRLESFGDLNQAVVFHEYAHSILHANFQWLPTWLDEGMAEFFAYTRFQGDHIFLGAPSVRIGHLQSDSLIPIPEMLTADSRTFAKNADRENIFYGEAWAMVHYMTFDPDMERGEKLQRFTTLIESGMQQRQAFEQVFGDPNVFLKKLSSYISRFAFKVGLFPPAVKVDTKAFSTRVLKVAEADFELGSFDMGTHDTADAKKRLQTAESAAPDMAGPHEELGFLAWLEGQDEAARTEWQKAVSADPSLYRSSFALLMSGVPIKQQNPQQLDQTQHALEDIVQKAPNFAPAFAELALIQWRLGQLNVAFKSSLAAEKLAPWRAGYHLLTGHILLRGRQPNAAANYARTVAARWPGADHDEAVDLWNLVPDTARGDEPALTYSFPKDAQVVRGTIVSSSCDKSGLSLVVQPEAQNASALTLAAAGSIENGFSDTLWVGEDHYTPCFHISGLPVVVAYKATPTAVNKLLEFEVRDNLPDLNTPASASKAAETSTPVPSN